MDQKSISLENIIKKDSMKVNTATLNLNLNGKAEIMTSNDLMKVKANFYPSRGDGKELSTNIFSKILNDHGIRYGVRWDIINKAIEKVEAEKSILKNVCIAQGLEPKSYVPQSYKINKSIIEKREIHFRVDDSVDHKKSSSLYIVESGDIIGDVIEETEGVYGLNVKNQKVSYHQKKPKYTEIGNNVSIKDGVIISEISGCLNFKSNIISVNEILIVEDDVDYSTGHIDFKGDVVIFGEISDGFHVKTGGALYSKSTLYASKVNCRENLFIEGGGIGRNQAAVTVGGDIFASFLEIVNVESVNNVVVEKAFVNSNINARGFIELGKRGRIIGGTYRCQFGLSCHHLGAPNNSITKVICKTHQEEENELETLHSEYNQCKGYLSKISTCGKAKAKQIESIVHKLETKVKELESQIAVKMITMNEVCKSKIKVSGTIYPGVHLEICDAVYKVKKELNNVCFFLNEGTGQIDYLPL